MKTSKKRLVTISAALLAASAMAGLAAAQGALTPFSFTTAQVAGGRANYAAKCALCHGAELEGGAGPALVNGALDGYLGGSVADLNDFLSASMPLNAPGTLTPDETATLIAFLASKNGKQAGAAPLPSDHAALEKMGFGQ